MTKERIILWPELAQADIDLLCELIDMDLSAFEGWIEYTYKGAEEDAEDPDKRWRELIDRRSRLELLQAKFRDPRSDRG